MNGPNTMYKMRPVIKLAEEIELPKCMYRMKRIQDSYCNARVENLLKNVRATSISEQSPLPEVAALESRQEAILEQLAQLKRQMSALRAQLKQPVPSTVRAKTTQNSTHSTLSQVEVPQDIVINANPQRPPYSIFALKQLWRNTFRVDTYIHSSVTDLPEHIHHFKHFRNEIENSPLVNVRLIWKDVSDAELVVAPSRHAVVQGEVNILRYLSRIGPSELNYESCTDPVTSSRIDDFLDICHSLSRDRTVKDRKIHVRTLNAQLKSLQCLAGSSSISLPDIAAWSALKQIGYTTTKDLTVSMNNWFQWCNEKLSIGS